MWEVADAVHHRTGWTRCLKCGRPGKDVGDGRVVLVHGDAGDGMLKLCVNIFEADLALVGRGHFEGIVVVG